MAITVKEKEHWKERITRTIDQAVEALLATEKGNLRSLLTSCLLRVAFIRSLPVT